MRIIGCCILVLALALICVGVASANPGGGVKNSPLFKASLEKSIAKLEGKIQREAVVGNEDEDMPTGKRICPNLPLTQQSTCEPSWCGGETCDVSCGGTCVSTCSGQSTCNNTCASTCENTCANTCVGNPGACKYFDFAGTAYWVADPYYGSNWTNLPYGFYIYQGSAGGVWVRFDDEGGQGTSISGVNASSGAFSGTRIHTNTNVGADLIHSAIVVYQYPYEVNGYSYISGPLATRGQGTNTTEIYTPLF